MKHNNTDITVNDLIKKYTDAISVRQAHVDFYQKQIETEKATINSFKEKINVLTDTLTDLGLNKEPNKFKPVSNVNRGDEKWEGLWSLQPDKGTTMKTEDLKFNDLTSKGQFNKCTSPIAPLTPEQIQALTKIQPTNESALDRAIKSLKDTLDKQNNKSVSIDILCDTGYQLWPHPL